MRILPAALLFIVARAQKQPSVELNTGKWTDDFECTVDLDSDQPGVIDASSCTNRTDANSKPCLWCDLSLFGFPGLCVSSDIEEFIGDYWEQVCAGGSGNETLSPVTPHSNPAPSPINPPLNPMPDRLLTPSPTKPPTPSPVVTPPAINPQPDGPPPDNSFVGAFSCATDDSSRMIGDEATCNAKKDSTSSTGQNCVWCPVPLVGGGCITNSDASSISWMCHGFEELIKATAIKKETQYLRGDNNGISVEGWEIMDPSCLGDTTAHNGLDAAKESCVSRNDKSGNPCIWCDGAGVLGYCVSPLQKGAFSSYMDCEVMSNGAIGVE